METFLYEGKAKKVYLANTPGQVVLSYKDDASAFNGAKKAIFPGKGRLNNEIAVRIFSLLHEKGIETHFIKRLNETEQLVYQTEMIPLEVIIRNQAAGNITRRLGVSKKTTFQPPILELFLKNDELGDPLVNDEHAFFLTNTTEVELEEIKRKAFEINNQLREIFESIGILLVDFKIEFGRKVDGSLVLADEISPDTCRLWDLNTKEKLDKDLFREGTGDLIEAYKEILHRLEEKG